MRGADGWELLESQGVPKRPPEIHRGVFKGKEKSKARILVSTGTMEPPKTTNLALIMVLLSRYILR